MKILCLYLNSHAIEIIAAGQGSYITEPNLFILLSTSTVIALELLKTYSLSNRFQIVNPIQETVSYLKSLKYKILLSGIFYSHGLSKLL